MSSAELDRAALCVPCWQCETQSKKCIRTRVISESCKKKIVNLTETAMHLTEDPQHCIGNMVGEMALPMAG